MHSDWRLTNQMNYLSDKNLCHMKYQPFREGWEHDHCAFCVTTIDTSTGEAYCTTDHYHWICENCYGDFREMFRWKKVDISEDDK